jgi:hypothetical protein
MASLDQFEDWADTKEPPCPWPSTKPMLAAERAMSLLGSSVLILVLVGIGAAEVPSEPPNTLLEAEMQHKLIAPIREKKPRYTHRSITSLAIEDFKQMALDARELRPIGGTRLRLRARRGRPSSDGSRSDAGPVVATATPDDLATRPRPATTRRGSHAGRGGVIV